VEDASQMLSVLDIAPEPWKTMMKDMEW